MKICENCGSADIKTVKWVDPNTNKISDDQSGLDMNVEWCNTCKDTTYMIDSNERTTETNDKPDKKEVLVFTSSGWWGRGTNLAEACKNANVVFTDKIVAIHVKNLKSFDDYGHIEADESIQLGEKFKVADMFPEGVIVESAIEMVEAKQAELHDMDEITNRFRDKWEILTDEDPEERMNWKLSVNLENHLYRNKDGEPW